MSSYRLVAQEYQIGFSNQNFNDASRQRTIPVAVYYPADVAGENVPVAVSTTGFPVISFGHGFVIPTESYSWLWQALVPMGYIVVLPKTEGQLLPAPSHPNFGLDIAFCADEIVRLGSLNSGPLAGKVLPRIALMGHSMGGGATYLGANGNNTVTTTITFGAADTNPSSIAAAAGVEAPSLVIAAVEDCVTPVATNQQPMYNNLPASPKAIVRIEGASHCNFTDGSASFCYLGEGFSCGGFGPFTTRQVQHARTLEVLTPWLEAFLLSDCSAGEGIPDLLDNGAGEGKWTYELAGGEMLPCPQVCGTPQSPQSSGSALSGFNLSWGEVPYALGYQYRVRTVGGGPGATELTALTTASTGPVPAALNLEYRVRSFCPGLGFGSWSPWVAISGGEGAALRAEMVGHDLLVFYESELPQTVQLEVYTLEGRLLLREQSGATSRHEGPARIDLNGLPKGLYVLSLVGDTEGRTHIKVALY